MKTHRPSPVVLALTALATLVALVPLTSARADVALDGKWRQSALREDFTVQRWQEGCGPPPRSSSTGGGESITVKSEGDVLAFVGGGRVYRSNQCYDQLPGLARESYSHAAGSRQWRTRCATPAGDPRKTVMQTLVVATSDTHINVTETGRYEIAHEGGLCVADVRRSRSFDLVVPDAPAASATASAPAPSAPPSASTPPPPSAPPPPPEPPPSACANPGPPARLEVRPSKKLLRAGETFSFRAKIVDEAGCPLPATVKWVARPKGPKITVDGQGLVSVAEGAAEGSYELEASAEGKTARVTVEISTAANYDALLAKQGLNAAGEAESASVSLPSESIGSAEVAAEDGRKARRATFMGIISAAVAALGAAYLVLRRRQKRALALETERITQHEDLVREIQARQDAKEATYREELEAHEASVRRAEKAKAKLAERERERARARARDGEQEAAAAVAAAATPAAEPELVCPTCQRTLRDTTFCPHDGSRLVPKSVHEASVPLLCPTCKRGFGEGTTICPDHREELVPLPAHGRPAPVKAGPKGKICPTCGSRYDGAAVFCGRDGTSLVLLN
ncbi:MAG: hypothetical protein IPQ09_13520 [Myxococcales bacterium]|nr:hypothetical protein [Myxococcales bacterium]HQY63334.1 hypothetical protein [Polyangiaceae bacterium]